MSNSSTFNQICGWLGGICLVMCLLVLVIGMPCLYFMGSPESIPYGWYTVGGFAGGIIFSVLLYWAGGMIVDACIKSSNDSKWDEQRKDLATRQAKYNAEKAEENKLTLANDKLVYPIYASIFGIRSCYSVIIAKYNVIVTHLFHDGILPIEMQTKLIDWSVIICTNIMSDITNTLLYTDTGISDDDFNKLSTEYEELYKHHNQLKYTEDSQLEPYMAIRAVLLKRGAYKLTESQISKIGKVPIDKMTEIKESPSKHSPMLYFYAYGLLEILASYPDDATTVMIFDYLNRLRLNYDPAMAESPIHKYIECRVAMAEVSYNLPYLKNTVTMRHAPEVKLQDVILYDVPVRVSKDAYCSEHFDKLCDATKYIFKGISTKLLKIPEVVACKKSNDDVMSAFIKEYNGIINHELATLS